MNEKGIKYFSTFSGIGGFELGIERAVDNRRTSGTSTLAQRRNKPSTDISDGHGRRTNAHCVGFSEVDKYAIQIYQRHFPDHHNYGDITAIDANALPDFDLYVGGFPCQAFSIAGKRAGFEDTRGTLFFDVARLLKAKRPKHFLLENVKGLLSHDNGRTFKTIISTLVELGYGVEWQVLNSKDFGVPQNRERVFIVGHLGGECSHQVFPLERDNEQNTLPVINELKGKTEYGWHFEQNVYNPAGLSRSLKAGGGSGNMPKIITEAQIRRLTPVECERLQSFPDNWTEGISDSQRYKVLGNAVTVNVIQAIIERLYDLE